MNIVHIFERLFTRPQFIAGSSVNLVVSGIVERGDGVVVSHFKSGVLVDWLAGGQSLEHAGELSLIA